MHDDTAEREILSRVTDNLTAALAGADDLRQHVLAAHVSHALHVAACLSGAVESGDNRHGPAGGPR